MFYLLSRWDEPPVNGGEIEFDVASGPDPLHGRGSWDIVAAFSTEKEAIEAQIVAYEAEYMRLLKFQYVRYWK
jgi:hypothetical protein